MENIKEKAARFAAFESSPDFVNWREQIVEKRLHGYIHNILNGDTETPEGIAQILSNLRRFQELKYATEDVFTTWEFAEKQAVKELQRNHPPVG